MGDSGNMQGVHDFVKQNIEFEILKKWKQMHLNEFIIYFKKQWLESDFSRWAIFSTPLVTLLPTTQSKVSIASLKSFLLTELKIIFLLV